MYKYKEFYITSDLVDFLNENKIPRENIIKIGGKYNMWTLVYYIEEPDTESVSDAPDSMEKDVWKYRDKDGACKGCYCNDGRLHAECVLCDKAESVEYNTEREE